MTSEPLTPLVVVKKNEKKRQHEVTHLHYI